MNNTEKKAWENRKDYQGPVGNTKKSNIWAISVPEGGEKECGDIFEEIMAENLTNLTKVINLQSLEAQ